MILVKVRLELLVNSQLRVDISAFSKALLLKHLLNKIIFPAL